MLFRSEGEREGGKEKKEELGVRKGKEVGRDMQRLSFLGVTEAGYSKSISDHNLNPPPHTPSG